MFDAPFHKLDLIRRSLSFQEPAVCQAFLDLEDEFFAMQRRLLRMQEELHRLRAHQPGAPVAEQANDPIPAAVPEG